MELFKKQKLCYNIQKKKGRCEMDHNTENLEHYSFSQDEKKESKYTERPLAHRLISWILIAVVLFGFIGTCYWLAFYGRG